eukprot:gene30396-37605_t
MKCAEKNKSVAQRRRVSERPPTVLGYALWRPPHNFHASVDNCGATNAFLNHPRDIWALSNGTSYITDSDGFRMRVYIRGIVSTVAGNGISANTGDNGKGTSATMNSPYYVWGSEAGAVLFSLSATPGIREIDVGSGNINQFIGNGYVTSGYTGDGGDGTSATMSTTPYGIFVSMNSTVYVSDAGNNVIRNRLRNNNIYTYAGQQNLVYNGDNQVATLTALQNPQGIFWDQTEGALFIADSSNRRVRYIMGGQVGTFAGNGNAGSGEIGMNGPATSAGLSTPSAVYCDGLGYAYICDSALSAVRKVSLSGNGATASPTIYLADYGNGRIRKVLTSTGIISTVAGNGDTVTHYYGEGIQATSSALYQPTCVGKLNTLAGMGDTTAPVDGVATSVPLGRVVHAWPDTISGEVWFSENYYCTVRRVVVSTTILTTVAGSNTASVCASVDKDNAAFGTLNGPLGITGDKNGTVY